MKNIKYILMIFLLFSLSACSSNVYKDGEYEGVYESEEKKSSAKVLIKISDGEITACKTEFFDANGDIKDENYGKNAGEAKYKIAQMAVKAMSQYDEKFLECGGNLDDLDVISGASISFKEFKIAVEDALSKAK